MRRHQNNLARKIEQDLLDRHGPLIGGEHLSQALGFVSLKAFRQARRRGRVDVHTFNIVGRRGSFALTSDVARWLASTAAG